MDQADVFGWVAYAYPNRREVRSAILADRLEAARQLLAAHPRLKSVSTCRAYRGFPTGQDIRSHSRREVQA